MMPCALAARINAAWRPCRQLTRGEQVSVVLEDTELSRVVGVSAEVAVGLDEPFTNFRIQKTVRASKRAGLQASGIAQFKLRPYRPSELCACFLTRSTRRTATACCSKRGLSLLPRSASGFHRICSPSCAGAAMSRNSPFWDSWGTTFRHSFRRCRPPHRYRNENLIAELMPAYRFTSRCCRMMPAR